MRKTVRFVALLVIAAVVTTAGTARAQAPAPGTRDALVVAGLRQPVEVIRDRWGINHIYAQNPPICPRRAPAARLPL